VRVPVALLLAASVLAGCSSSSPSTPGGHAPTTGVGDGWTFTSVLVGEGGDAETSITAAANGVVLACSHGGFGKPSPSWVSKDSGTTWAALDPQPNPIVSGDCDWAVLADGTWAIVYDTVGSATVASSADQGATWRFDYASAVPFGGVDRPWLSADGNTLYLNYANVMAEEPAVNTLAVSHDGGRTFTEQHVAHTFVGEGSSAPQSVIGRALVKGSTIRIPLASADLSNGGPATLSFAVSRDGGATWSQQPIAAAYPTFFQLPSAAQAPDGTLFATKVAGKAGHLDLAVLVSRDDGETWSEIPVAHDYGQPSVSYAWVAARADNTATVAWMEETFNGDKGTGERSVWAARVSATGIVHAARALAPPVHDNNTVEFIEVDHLPDGRAILDYPADTGADCHKSTAAAPGRSHACIYALIED
jgi:hypothetical protein